MKTIVKFKCTGIKTNKKISIDIAQGKYESYKQKEIHQRKENKTKQVAIRKEMLRDFMQVTGALCKNFKI